MLYIATDNVGPRALSTTADPKPVCPAISHSGEGPDLLRLPYDFSYPARLCPTAWGESCLELVANNEGT